MTTISVAALSALMALGGPIAPAGPSADSIIGPGDAVPYLAQAPLLCGGAAAAMVERFWGARGVYAEDYEDLVRPGEGGIRTSELAAALRERGFDVGQHLGDPELVLEQLRGNHPPILLLGPGRSALHYVVLVALGEDVAWIHDPNDGPARRLPRDELMRRWSDSGYWALVATPKSDARGVVREGGDPTPGAHGAESGTSDARDLVTAMALLRAGEHAEARAAVRQLVDGGVGGGEEARLAQRIVATSYYLEGQRTRALEAWNELGEPEIDIVRVAGTRSIRHIVVTDRMGLRHGDTLTADGLGLARRRLSDVPGVLSARVDYVPLPDGSVEVRASVLERAIRPGRAEMMLEAGDAALAQEAGFSTGPLMGSGDRWRVAGSWAGAHRHALGGVRTPAYPLPGVLDLSLEWRAERYGAGLTGLADASGSELSGSAVEERVRGALELSEWVGPKVAVTGGIGLERWATGARMGSLAIGADWVSPRDRLRVRSRLEGWAGDAPAYGRASVVAVADVPETDRRSWWMRLHADYATERAPMMLWPGAGIGRMRPALLRGHPLVRGDEASGPAIGRALVSATVEHRLMERIGPLRAGAALFVDAAVVWRPESSSRRAWMDPGVALLALVGDRTVALSFAYGDGWVVSARVE